MISKQSILHPIAALFARLVAHLGQGWKEVCFQKGALLEELLIFHPFFIPSYLNCSAA